MKQIITFLGLACTMANAQINIAKDTSFGTNGTVTISGVGSNNYLLLIPNIHSTFQGNKIFVSYPSGSSSETQFTRLNSDGSLDASFGNNGNVLIPYFEAYYFYANNNFFLTNGNKKYLSNGQPDSSFSGSAMQAADWNYKLVLSDGKIFFRDDAGFYKFLPDGTPDSSYGINGLMGINAAIAGDPNGNSSYEFFFNTGNALYEFINPSPGQSSIRKIDINTGNLDTSYGQGGYAQVRNSGIPSAASYDSGIQASQNDGSFINKFTDSNHIYFTKTNIQGNLDPSVGTNGTITGNKSFAYNGTVYSADAQPLAYNNLIFVPAENSAQELGIACYSLNGNNVTINNNTFYPLSGTSYTYPGLRFIFVKDNYIYVIHDNNISRFVIQQQVLSADGLFLKNQDIRINNPFKDELSLFADEPVNEVEIADGTGRIVLKGKKSKLNTSSLVKGNYFVKITTASGKVISKKAVKN
ncbi:T9SS type A sorting domain-containing protein [uncultured Chryseobacterium sp.]|uniref:T9SS type A sorting domain-containing protein n=1 Tax=uncultured Chryseobacterium sp. TaxID=259322 RepID=UPI0025E4BEE2|nr:T9SS type A sorting domain-containing protein [uncultured Chryseobacterium sp.]